MLVFLVLCAFLQKLLGAPVPPTHVSNSVITVDMFSFTAREVPVDPDCGGPQCRTAYSILQSCFVTIFVCVWTSAHPNINGPMDSGWTCFKRKVVTMLCVVIAPELVLFWALGQRSAAKEIAEKYNKEFIRTEEAETSLKQKVVDWFRPLPKTRRGGQLWTTTHGFFIQMGGFILYEDEYPTQVLDYERLAKLLLETSIDAPTVTERDLQDRSKGDTISKAIAVLQTMWFACQCFGRWGQHLPLSQLEVLTFAFAVVNVAIYAAWWNKPQAVDVAICVPRVREAGESTTHTMIDSSIHPIEDPDASAGKMQSWLRRMIEKDRANSPLLFPLFIPYRIIGAVIRLFLKMGDVATGGVIKQKDLRVPMFYASTSERVRPQQALCIIGMIFGAIHLIAWASEFTSRSERVLWRVSAILSTMVPLLTLSGWGAQALGMEGIADCIFWPLLLLVPAYIVSRFILVIVALLTIYHPPTRVLIDVSWNLYVPHF